MQQLQPDMEPVRFYREAVTYAEQRTDCPSIVAASVLSAVEGHYGNFHSNDRTRGSVLYINPLMGMMWAFSLEHVVRRWRPGLAEALLRTESRLDVANAVRDFRAKTAGKQRAVEEFPRTHDFETVVAPGS